MLKDECNNFSVCKVKPPVGLKLDNAMLITMHHRLLSSSSKLRLNFNI